MPGSVTPLHQRLVDRISRHGPVPYSAAVEAALYDPEHGFYSRGGAAGRRGDFITSPEVGPLFGAVLARALDAWWGSLGEPDPFVVVEGGAGIGTLAVSVLAARPRCAPALRYLLIERSGVLRAEHGRHLALTEPSVALGLPGGHDGPLVVSLSELQAIAVTGVVLANELLDNIAFDLLVRTEEGWGEVLVGLEGAGSTTRLVQHVVPASEAARTAGERFAPAAPLGALIPWQRGAAEWVRSARGLLEAGRLVVFDYAVERSVELAARPVSEWLRAYRGHQRVDDPLEALGTADITVEVCIDQLAATAGEPGAVVSQAEFLRAWGIEELVADGARVWEERAGLGDLEAIRGRSRLREAEALLDPHGLGAFLVAEWQAP